MKQKKKKEMMKRRAEDAHSPERRVLKSRERERERERENGEINCFFCLTPRSCCCVLVAAVLTDAAVVVGRTDRE